MGLKLEGVDILNVNRLPGAIEGDDDGQADGHLGGGHGDNQEDKHLRVVVGQPVLTDIEPAEGHEGQVRRVEHELEAHENRDDIAPENDTGKTDGKQQAADEQ